MEAIRQLLDAGQEPHEEARLRVALGRGERWLEERARLRRTVVERLQERPTSELYKQAAELVKDPDASAQERESVAARARRVQEQERADRELEKAARREAEERAELRAAVQRERAERTERLQAEKAEAKERAALQSRLEKAQELAPAVRGALKKAAREQRTTTWPEIQQTTGLRQLGGADFRWRDRDPVHRVLGVLAPSGWRAA
ncbi:hypothetical protein [Streptomyces chartreusis]|uniref:hypothetical protein n=1 Tax=Streptomyces chartreusis TaxID=1969 RepID=UPI003803D37C